MACHMLGRKVGLALHSSSVDVATRRARHGAAQSSGGRDIKSRSLLDSGDQPGAGRAPPGAGSVVALLRPRESRGELVMGWKGQTKEGVPVGAGLDRSGRDDAGQSSPGVEGRCPSSAGGSDGYAVELRWKSRARLQ